MQYRSLSSVIYFYFEIIGSSVLAWVSALALFISGIIYFALHVGCYKKVNEENVLEDDEEDYRERLT
jgi:cbb3-type cytochrome oxidase subunit 3